MANPNLHLFGADTGYKDVNAKKSFLLYIVIDIIIWMSFMAGTRTESSNCPMKCSCLGGFVDCSEQGLTQVPSDLPDWMEKL
jgi:hypothetical protein